VLKQKKMNLGPLTNKLLELMLPLLVDNACSAYANTFKFGLLHFATRGISTL